VKAADRRDVSPVWTGKKTRRKFMEFHAEAFRAEAFRADTSAQP